jgi:predicted GTPase
MPGAKGSPEAALRRLRQTIAARRPGIPVVEGDLEITLDSPLDLAGRRVLCIEDGPTTSHGGMAFGAAVVAAKKAGAVLVDPRPHAVGSLAEVFNRHPHLKECLPAMGYSNHQVLELAETIARTPCDAVIVGTPIDLRRILDIGHPSARAVYRWRDSGKPGLAVQVLRMLRAQ